MFSSETWDIIRNTCFEKDRRATAFELTQIVESLQ